MATNEENLENPMNGTGKFFMIAKFGQINISISISYIQSGKIR